MINKVITRESGSMFKHCSLHVHLLCLTHSHPHSELCFMFYAMLHVQYFMHSYALQVYILAMLSHPTFLLQNNEFQGRNPEWSGGIVQTGISVHTRSRRRAGAGRCKDGSGQSLDGSVFQIFGCFTVC